jgi:hypothetical protein
MDKTYSSAKTIIDTTNLNKVVLTQHAQERRIQRAIKPSWIALVLEYGRYTFDEAKRVYEVALDGFGSKQIIAEVGYASECKKISKLKLVLSEQSVLITCMFRS